MASHRSPTTLTKSVPNSTSGAARKSGSPREARRGPHEPAQGGDPAGGEAGRGDGGDVGDGHGAVWQGYGESRGGHGQNNNKNSPQ